MSDDEYRVIEIGESAGLSVREVANAAARIEATLALVVADDRPIAILRVGELDETDETPILERAREQSPLKVWTSEVPESAEYVPGLTAFVEGDLVVMQREDSHLRFVVPREGRAIENLFAPGIRMFAADIRLPGPPPPPTEEYVTYRCLNGHLVTQLASNPNRGCGTCGEPLGPT